MRGSNGCNVFGRKISSEVIKKAGMVLIINLVLGLTAVIAILATSNMKMDDVLFEVYSAISTVGMTTGITRDLNTVGRIIIIIMMYCGRIGSMTFVLSFVHRPDKANIELPDTRELAEQFQKEFGGKIYTYEELTPEILGCRMPRKPFEPIR